jgi:hypothetical protein
MKPRFFFVILLISVLAQNCSTNKTYAEYSDTEPGSSTLSQFRITTADIEGVKVLRPDFQIEKLTPEQVSQLSQGIATRRIIKNKLINTQAISSEDMALITELAGSQLQMGTYRDRFQKNLENSKLHFVTLQVLLVRGNDESAKNTANEHIKQLKSLKSKSSLDQYISQNTTDNYRRELNGILEPLCVNCGSHELDELIQGIQDGEGFMTKEISGNTLVIRVIKEDHIVPRRVAAYYQKHIEMIQSLVSSSTSEETKVFRERSSSELSEPLANNNLKNFYESEWQSHFQTLIKQSGFEVSELPFLNAMDSNKGFPPESEMNQIVLLKKEGNDYLKFSEFHPKFQKVWNLLSNDTSGPKDKYLKDLFSLFYDIYLPGLIIQTSDEWKKIEKSDSYKKSIELFQESICWNYYLKESTKMIVISDSDALTHYETYKNILYLKSQDPNSGNRSFAEVKQDIINQLSQEKKQAVIKNLIEQIKEEHKLKTTI